MMAGKPAGITTRSGEVSLGGWRKSKIAPLGVGIFIMFVSELSCVYVGGEEV